MDTTMGDPSTQQSTLLIDNNKLKASMEELTAETEQSSYSSTCTAGEPTLERSEDSSSSTDEREEPMDVDVCELSSPDVGVDDTKDVLDQKELLTLLEQSKEAGKLIAGEDILLLIGGTGAGKTTTTLYLAGAKLDEVEKDGTDHYEPRDLPDHLAQFKVSGSAKSVTKTIHATTIKLPNGNPVTICDTPGFGDTKGAEMEIANGLGVIHALQRTKSVKPVLVFDHAGLTTGRFTMLRKTLKIVVLMMGRTLDFSSFQYIFTRCNEKESKRIWKKLAPFLEEIRVDPCGTLGNDAEDADVLIALVSDMIEKTNPQALYIEPTDEDAAPKILESLWCSNSTRLHDPKSSFQDFLSTESADKLLVQVARMQRRLEKALKGGLLEDFQATMDQLIQLSETLSQPYLLEAVEQGRVKGRDFICQAGDHICSLTDRMGETYDPEAFSKLAQELIEKFASFAMLQTLAELCQVPEIYLHDHLLEDCSAKLFAGITASLAEVQSATEVVGWHKVLQDALLRTDIVAAALDGHFPKDKLSSMYEAPVASVSNLIRFHLNSVEKNLGYPTTTEALAESKSTLLSLRKMKKFLFTGFGSGSVQAFGKDNWQWLGNQLRDIWSALAAQSNASVMLLKNHTLNEDCNNHEWKQSLLGLKDESDLVGSRSFLFEVASIPYPDLHEEIARNLEKEGIKPPCEVVEDFDRALCAAFAALSEVANTWSSQKQASSEKKNAVGLLKTVDLVREVCKVHRASGMEALDEIGKSLVRTKMALELFIEKCNTLFQRPDELLYGPEELGKPFHSKLVELRAYKIKHGDCNVPQKYPQNPSLGIWVHNQRTQFGYHRTGAKNQLTDKRIEALADLDFEWSLAYKKMNVWETRFAELQEFKEENGHCNVPQKFAPNQPLGTWVMNQRAAKTKGKMTREKSSRLESIGFQWSTK